jgi:non-ribosomal peptide synthetase component F
VREVALDAYTHQEVPFERVVEDLAPTRDARQHPLATVGCSLDTGLPPLRLPDLRVEPVATAPPSAKVDLNLLVHQTPTEVAGQAIYNCDLFDAATIGRFVARWVELLEAMAANPDATLDELPRLSVAEEEERASEELEAQQSSYTRFKRITRDAIAVSD